MLRYDLPSLPGGYDFGIVRLMGAGIGNCLYAYFHAVVLAREANCRIITPTWSSVKVGPLLRRERSLRRYRSHVPPTPRRDPWAYENCAAGCVLAKTQARRIRVGQRVSAARRGLTIVGVPAHALTLKGCIRIAI